MIEEIRIFGIYMPSGLLWAALAMIVTFFVRDWLNRLPLHLVLWQPALIEMAVFVLLWWSIASLADAYLPPGVIS
jgi:protein AaeX